MSQHAALISPLTTQHDDATSIVSWSSINVVRTHTGHVYPPENAVEDESFDAATFMYVDTFARLESW